MKKRLIYFFIFLIALNQSANLSYAQVAAASPGVAAPGSAGAATGAQKAGGLKGLLGSPAGRIILASIATVYSGILYNAASKQEKESEENIKKIDKIIASFKDSYAAFCPKGREDLKDPKCYCYTDAGKQNANRSNSQTCKDLWAKDNYKLMADAKNYGLLAYDPDVAGCVAVTGQFDENCKCKKLIDAKGNNACKKEASLSFPADAFSTGLATSTGVKDLTNFAANSSNGNPRFDLMNAGNLATKAVNARKFRDQLISKLQQSGKGGTIPLIDESNADKYARAVLGEKAILAAMSSGGMPMNVSDARSDNPVMNNLLKEAQAKAGIEVMGSGNGVGAKKEKKKNGFDLNFANDSSGGAAASQVVQDFPEKTYKYKNSDIVTDNSASIFEIISNRYIQSGLKRLFDDETGATN